MYLAFLNLKTIWMEKGAYISGGWWRIHTFNYSLILKGMIILCSPKSFNLILSVINILYTSFTASLFINSIIESNKDGWDNFYVVTPTINKHKFKSYVFLKIVKKYILCLIYDFEITKKWLINASCLPKIYLYFYLSYKLCTYCIFFTTSLAQLMVKVYI